MITFEWIIGLLIGSVALLALARRLGVPYPIFLAIGGVVLTFLPIGPSFALDPELALTVFVAPVLLDAAFDTSLRELRYNWIPVATLVLVAVVITTIAVAVTARWLMPEMSWAVAIALGAIVAPPDAAAAVAVLRQIKLPYRLLKILEGESLLNDASALLIYRIAVSTAVTQHLEWRDFAPTIALGLAGSLVAGYVLAKISMMVTRHVTEAPSAIILQFANTFAVWIIAERLQLSGILTIVVYAITIARIAPARTPARLRVPSYAVWETVVFVLNVGAFVLIGMQLRPIWDRLAEPARLDYSLFAATILAVTILVRMAWVMSSNTFARLKIARFGHHPRRPMAGPTLQSGLVISWCGMRGIVTLAAAFALPESFPQRDLILLTAFAVVIGTLLIQGLTLKPLIAALALGDDDTLSSEVGHARSLAYSAALDTIKDDTSQEAELLRLEYRKMLKSPGEHPSENVSGEFPADPLRRRAIAAAREKILDLRRTEEIGDDAFHRLEEELDWAEMSARA